MSKTIVIIDDEPMIRESLQRALSKQPCEILVADDGDTCVTLLTTLKTRALFLVDLLMPHMDGWGLLDRIREHGASLGVEHRIILLSGNANANIIAAQEQVGLIAKPFSLAEIKAKILPFLEEE